MTMTADLQSVATQRQSDSLAIRNDIAYALENAVTSHLGALCIHLEAVRGVLNNHDVHRGLAMVEQAHLIAADALHESHQIERTLSGGPTDLADQISELATAHRKHSRTALDVQIDRTVTPLAPAATVALLGATQAALAGAATHAPGQPVRILLLGDAHDVCVAITGRLGETGAPDRPRSMAGSRLLDGYRLTNMRERLLLLDGSLTTEFDQRRWTITARVPR